ncbi:hypothetical protein EPUL_005814, partial [Erysiphe pulchra]
MARKGIKKSPPLGERVIEAIGDGEDPFRKRGLRRSPQVDIEMKLDVIENSDLPFTSSRSLEAFSAEVISPTGRENTRSNKTLKMSQQDTQGIDELITKKSIESHKEVRYQKLLTESKPSVPQPASINLSDSLFVSPNSSIKSILGSRQDSPSNLSNPGIPYSNAKESPIVDYSESDETGESSNMPFQDLIQYSQKNKNDLRDPQDLSPELLQKNHDRIFEKENSIALSPQLCSSETAGTTSILDPYKAKRALKSSLLQEIKQLQEDIVLADSENERLRLTRIDPKAVPPIDEKVLSMLKRVTCPEISLDKKMNKKTILQSLHNFLPFSSRRFRSPRKDTQKLLHNKMKMPSFLPQSVENPLPYLQAFTPLIWSSKITTLRPPRKLATLESEKKMKSKKIDLLQQQIITASHSQGLFFARLALLIDPNSRSVHQLSLLSIPLCAEHELGSFIRSSKKGENRRDSKVETNQSSYKDLSSGITDNKNLVNREIGVVCYAMGRWLQVSLRRARFWWLASKHFSTPEARKRFIPLYTLSKTTRRKNAKDRGKKRKRVVSEESIDDETDDDTSDFNRENNQTFEESFDLSEDETTKKSGNWIRKELLPHLGRSFLCISKNGLGTFDSRNITNSQNDSDFEILFEWRLSFDWTGEIKSHLSAIPKVPKSWYKSLDAQVHCGFDQIPNIFQGLLHEKGPIAAVACLINLTMVEE